MAYTPKEDDTEDPLSADSRYPFAVWDLLYDVLEHPWWSRAWAYQEFMIASRTMVVFSHDFCIDWEEFHTLRTRFLALSFL
jgi:hypothetical protein